MVIKWFFFKNNTKINLIKKKFNDVNNWNEFLNSKNTQFKMYEKCKDLKHILIFVLDISKTKINEQYCKN